jgi:hypothetical protein
MIFLMTACKQETTLRKTESIPQAERKPPALFTLMTTQQTNIDFVNTLTEGLNTNILMYEYFYNGGGVAIADLNNDELMDIYFTSNMAENKLYLNKGNLAFQDITSNAGVSGREGPWKTGITMVDINGDNKIDIYLSYSGMLPDEKRVNQLFINEGTNEDGIPHFTEQAEKYGLASAAFSNQAYFFDCDHDGDLDALLLNHNPRNLPILNEISTAQMLKKDNPSMGIRLLKQTNGRFDDVTQKSGISSSELTYGLGIGISDLNDDGWADFYISNDYSVPDYLYVNNRKGGFVNKLEEAIGHNSQFSMGNDVADVNNDGLSDIITLDMLPEDNHRQKLLLAPDNYAKFDLNVRSGFHYQYMRNMLQLNNGNGTFSEIGQLAGISNTDWSWAPLLADYDNDGWKDLYVTNGYLRDYTNLDFIKYMDDIVKTKGRLQRDDVLEIINKMPASNVVNYIFRNTDGINFNNQTKAWGMNRSSNSNGASYADLDNDGDLDIVVNNINQPVFIYRNESSNLPGNSYLQVKLHGTRKNTQGIGAKVTIRCKDGNQVLEQFPTRGYLSSVSPVLHFGLGTETMVDSLTITWPGGKEQILTNIKSNQTLDLTEADAKDIGSTASRIASFFEAVQSPIKHTAAKYQGNDFKRQPLLIKQLSSWGPCLAKGDVNGDGMDDIYVGGGNGQTGSLYIQQRNNEFLRTDITAFRDDTNYVDADALFFDANGDGHLDLYVASGGYHAYAEKDKYLQDRLYLNNGTGDFTKNETSLPEMLVSKGCVAAGDANNDGHMDLFVGGKVIPGRYPETPSSYLLINDGKGNFRDQISSMAPALQKVGMVTDAVFVDLNSDNKKDLLVVGEWLPVSVFTQQDRKFVDETLNYFDKEYHGWWNKIEVADFNNDQKPDLFIGNAGTNMQLKASVKEPVELYFKDFDNNGALDPFLCSYIQGKSYPYVTRDEMLEQVGMLRSRFTTFNSYADVTLEDIFGKDALHSAGYHYATHLETTLFLSDRDGKFKTASLPIQAQFAPVHTITVLDFDGDSNKDVLLCGNESQFKLRLGKSDANYGILMRGFNDGTFQYIDQTKSGLLIRGDVRAVVGINNTLLFGICERPMVSFRNTK